MCQIAVSRIKELLLMEPRFIYTVETGFNYQIKYNFQDMKTLLFTCILLFVCFGCSGTEKKEMKASEIVKTVKKGKPVLIVNRIIFDDLDLTTAGKPFVRNANMLQVEIPSNIYFDGCVFLGKVTSNGKHGNRSVQSCFRNNLSFVGCDFRGDVDFDGATVFGAVNFGRSVFRENASFTDMTVWAKDSYFSEMKAEKNFLMVNSFFAGSLHFTDAAFDRLASFQETSVRGKLVFNNGVFAERAGFDLMEVYGSAFFNYVKFDGTADFSNTRFMYAVNFVKTVFNAQASFEKAMFMHSVHFEEVDHSRLNLTDVRIIQLSNDGILNSDDGTVIERTRNILPSNN